jgi:hypothetical protein
MLPSIFCACALLRFASRWPLEQRDIRAHLGLHAPHQLLEVQRQSAGTTKVGLLEISRREPQRPGEQGWIALVGTADGKRAEALCEDCRRS